MNNSLPKLILCCSLLILSLQVHATNYYFSDEIGNDSRSKTQAQNPDTPWKSINKLNAIFSSLKPGDAIFFKRGDVFYGTIEINRGGSPGNPIKLDSYGSGEKPIITSFEKVKGWKSIGNGRYESSNTFSNHESNIVTVSGKIYGRGRYPNIDNGSNSGYLTISSSSGNSSVSSKELSGSTNFKNGEVVIRKNQWILDRHPINSHSGGTINYSGSGSYAPSTGYGFFIQNHLSTLDQFGEWYYNNSRKLNVYFGNTNPNNHEVQMSTLENLIVKSYNVNHILIQSLHLKGANKDAIYIGEGKDVVINNSDVEFSGENGITSLNIKNLKITNCKINYSLNNGLNLRYGNDNAIIKDNIIENSFPILGASQNRDNNGNGILVSGDNVLVENNTVKKIGFNGIHFIGNNVTVKNNLIQEFCILKNDCGGIYTFGGKDVKNFSNRVIENNIIVDGLSTNNGTPNHESPTFTPQGSGIFLDDNVNAVSVIKNTIANTNYSGIKASNVFNVTVKENTFYNSHVQALVGNSDRGADTRNVSFTENIFFSKFSDQLSYRINSFKDDIGNFGSFDNNYFARPLGDNHSISLNYYKNNKRENKIQDLNEWRKSYNKDLSSTLFEQNIIKPFSLIKFLGSWLYDNVLFNDGTKDFNCNECSQSWDRNGISGGSIKIKSPGYSSALVRIGSVKEDKSYVVKFKAKSNKKGSLRVVLRYAGTPWEMISPSTVVELGTGVKEYSVLINPYTDVADPVIMFISDIGNWDYWIDDLQIKEANVEVPNPDDVFKFEYNASKSSKEIPLNGTFKDTKGKSYSGKIQIAPYSSVLLLKTSEITTTPPPPPPAVKQEIKISSPSANNSYSKGTEINISAEVTPNIENINKVEFYNGDLLIGHSTDHPFKYTWKNAGEGDHQIKAVLVNDSNNKIATSSPISINIKSEEKDPTGSIDFGNNFALHINLGSSDNKTYNGKEFENLGTTEIQTGSTNSRDLDGSLHGSVDFNEDMYYKIPVPNGIYTLQTFHKEIYFGLDGVGGGTGSRVFNIKVENQTKYENLDLYALNGNKDVILTHENIEVNDGYLDITLKASVNNALISGFSIVEKGINNPGQSIEGAKFINVGGNDETFEGNLFVSDYSTKYYSSSGASENTTASNSPIFQTIRFDKELVYNIPVENGEYRVITYHIENYFGVTHPDGRPGLRVFDIFMQNKLVKSNLDLYSTSGNQETTLVFNEVIVNNGELKIELNASVNNALLAGIAIIPMNVFEDELDNNSFFVNIGSDVDTQYKNVNFISENRVTQIPSNSQPYNVPTSSSYQLFQSNRYGSSLEYKFPVSNGKYTVITYHNENYFGEITSETGPNRRVFDISIEGNKVKSKLDLFIENSNQSVAFRFEDIDVTDGVLNLNLDAITNNALISGVAVFPSAKENLGNSNLRQIIHETEELATLSELRENGIKDTYENKLYPNPAATSTTLQIGKDLGRFHISIYNLNGQLIDFFDSENLLNSDGTYEIPLNQLKQGIYIVTLSSDTEVLERMRLAVTP